MPALRMRCTTDSLPTRSSTTTSINWHSLPKRKSTSSRARYIGLRGSSANPTVNPTSWSFPRTRHPIRGCHGWFFVNGTRIGGRRKRRSHFDPSFFVGGRYTFLHGVKFLPDVMPDAEGVATTRGKGLVSASFLLTYPIDAIPKVFGGVGLVTDFDRLQRDWIGELEWRTRRGQNNPLRAEPWATLPTPLSTFEPITSFGRELL